jgi:hypothetical protein
VQYADGEESALSQNPRKKPSGETHQRERISLSIPAEHLAFASIEK